MANTLFDSGREGFLDGTINWSTGTIKVALTRGYTFNVAHKFVTDATGAGATLVSTSSGLASKTVTAGVADAADPVFASVAAGLAIPAILIFQSSAAAGGSDVSQNAQRLICYLDTGTNFPVTPNGQNITVAFDNGPLKIFRL